MTEIIKETAITKRVNGKSKGNSFERKIANALSDRFSQLLGIKSSFRRNADSGSFFGGANMRRVNEYDLDHANFGDLICPKNFNFSIECKHYKTPPTFQSIIKQSVTQWDKWVSQAEQDAKNSGKLVLLIIKYNNVPEFAMIKDKLAVDEIFKYNGYYAYTLDALLAEKDELFFTLASGTSV